MNPRATLIFDLRITPLAGVQHGGDGDGSNIVPIRRIATNSVDANGNWGQTRIPSVSGGALKGILRQIAVRHHLATIGITEGGISRAALRLLAKGGLLSGSTGQSVGIEEARRYCRLFPVLGAFGAMDNSISLGGAWKGTDVRPYTRETAHLPWMRSTWGEESASPVAPIALDLVTTEVTHYRHDIGGSNLSHLIAAADRVAIEDRAAANKVAKGAGKALPAKERREANDSMPHTAEVITPGTPLAGQVQLVNALEAERSCAMVAIAIWRQEGAIIGGASGKGHGRCDVQIVNARLIDGAAVVPTVLDGVTLPVQYVEADLGAVEAWNAYHAHLERNRAESLDELAKIGALS